MVGVALPPNRRLAPAAPSRLFAAREQRVHHRQREITRMLILLHRVRRLCGSAICTLPSNRPLPRQTQQPAQLSLAVTQTRHSAQVLNATGSGASLTRCVTLHRAHPALALPCGNPLRGVPCHVRLSEYAVLPRFPGAGTASPWLKNQSVESNSTARPCAPASTAQGSQPGI